MTTMPARTNEFQQLIAAIQVHMDPHSSVTESKMLRDRETDGVREVDIHVAGTVGGHPLAVSIECCDRSRTPDVGWVDAMKCKHSRLDTNLLVLASHSGFSAEAKKVAALYNIRCWALDDVEAAAPNRLFPDVDALWGKAWSLTIEHVKITVAEVGDLASEIVRVSSENSLFLEDGTPAFDVGDLATSLIRSELLRRKLAVEAAPEHEWLECGINGPP